MDKDKLTEKARLVLRQYLVRCYRSISEDYPEIQNMAPENAADFLLHLKNTGRIEIKIDTIDSLLKCSIINVQKHSKDT